jgi:hypothetical protein
LTVANDAAAVKVKVKQAVIVLNGFGEALNVIVKSVVFEFDCAVCSKLSGAKL